MTHFYSLHLVLEQNVVSDAGFVFSVKIYPGIRSPYVFLSLFSSVAGLFTISKVQKRGGLAFLTTSLCVSLFSRFLESYELAQLDQDVSKSELRVVS